MSRIGTLRPRRGRACGGLLGAWALALLPAALLAPAALAAPPRESPAVVEPGSDRSTIDWTRGLVTASGAAAGDLRAPSPEMARVGAERKARAQARERLRARAWALQVGDRTVERWAREDQAVAARLEQALDRLLDLDIDYGSDGSVVLTAGLPLEAVRLAVQGVPVIALGQGRGAGAGTPGATAILVDARKVLSAPALGLAIAAGDQVYAGPTVFHRLPGKAAADPRAGRRPLRARATGLADGRLTLSSLSPQALASARAAGALVIVVIGKP